ncbi:MAG: hypothetical protein ACXIUO_14750 [Erythrobacter sp.]
MFRKKILCAISLVGLNACSETSYDECVVNGLKSRSSAAAVEAIESSCRRKYETERISSLKAVINRELKPYSDGSRVMYFQVSNDTADIVTIIDVKVTDDYDLRYETWIEPSRWVELELPADKERIPSQLRRGDSLRATSFKVIPVK